VTADHIKKNFGNKKMRKKNGTKIKYKKCNIKYEKSNRI